MKWFRTLQLVKLATLVVCFVVALAVGGALLSWQSRQAKSVWAASAATITQVDAGTDDVAHDFDLDQTSGTFYSSYINSVTGDLYVSRSFDSGETWQPFLVDSDATLGAGTSITSADGSSVFVT